MNDPCFGGLVRIEARITENRRQHYAQRSAAANTTTKRQAQLPLIPSTPAIVDHKRRAAGEREDDYEDTCE